MGLVYVADLLLGRIEKLLRPWELSPGAGLVLSMLADASTPVSPHEIASRLIITRATVTGLLDSLEKRGYARREPHPDDRRMLRIRVTPSGKKAAAQYRALVHSSQKEWFSALSAQEKHELARLIVKLHESMNA